MNGGTLNLKAYENGLIRFDDEIVGKNYKFNVLGDNTGVVEFNNIILGLTGMKVSSGNVKFGENSKINYIMNIEGGSVSNLQIVNNGIVNANKGQDVDEVSLNNVVVYENGKLVAKENVKINGLIGNDGASIELDKNVLLSGIIEIDVNAVLLGEYDYSSIFNASLKDSAYLVLERGINDVLGDGALVNTSDKNATITIDVDPQNNLSDKLIIDGDVKGKIGVVINPLSDGLASKKIVFVEALNDDLDTGAWFDVTRVIGDAHKWNSLWEGKNWYIGTDNVISVSQSGYGSISDGSDLELGVNDKEDNDVTGGDDNTGDDVVGGGDIGGSSVGGNVVLSKSKIQVVSEALVYMSIPRIGLEQIRNLIKVVSDNVSKAYVKYMKNDNQSDANDNLSKVCEVKESWVDLGHYKMDIKAPVDVEAKVNSVDLGFDVQRDNNNRLGVFAFYRQGDYDLSGNGKKYFADEGAEIDIDSWTLGLYHHYNKGNLFKYDNMSDKYGKTARFDDVQNLELEAGVKIEKTWFTDNNNVVKLFVKPAVIQNFGSGDVSITSLETTQGVYDEFWVRGDVGGSVGLENGFSLFGNLGYIKGKDYEATEFNFGVMYKW